jgi:hypothetical protein
MKAFLCELIFSCAVAGPGAMPVDELTYRNMLYSYYQQDNQQALVSALVAREQGREGENPVRFDLARGSFAFSDGMYGYARETFDSVAEGELTDLDQMRLGFHLAREYHRRQDWVQLGPQLEKIDLGRSWLGRRKFHPEVEFMRAELAVHNGQYAEAEAALARLDEDDPLRAYGLFNLGVAMREADDLTGAERTLEALASTPLEDEDNSELADLKERAKLALSFVAREQQQPRDAEAVLGALPAESRYRDLAMAAYGGLAMETQDYELAARIWMTLQQQDYWTSSTAQARLGFPVSLEKLASQDLALLQYRAAEQSFENRLAVLTDLNEQAADPIWVRGLLLVFSAPDRDQQRMNQIMDRWEEQLGHTDWIEWLATEATHEVLLEWRELLGMQDWLDRLPAKLESFEEVAVERRRRAAKAKVMLHDEGLLRSRSMLGDQIVDQADRLAMLRGAEPVPERDWMWQLGSAEERELIDDLENMRKMVVGNMKPDEQKRWLARIDRLTGVLFWQLMDQSSIRIRELETQLRDNRKLVAEVDSRVSDVESAEAEFSAGVETDFHLFLQRADAISAEVNTARENREIALAAELKRGMQREMREVQQYLLVTRIAIARATDQLAISAGEEGEAGQDVTALTQPAAQIAAEGSE